MDNTIHNHRQPFSRNVKLISILQNDKLEDFLTFNHSELKDEFIRIKCTKCDAISPLSCVLAYNKSKIAKYLMTLYPPTVADFLLILNSGTKNTTKDTDEFFISMFLHHNMKDNEIRKLINILSIRKRWTLVDFLHIYGFQAYDSLAFFRKLSDSYVNKYKVYYKDYVNSNDFIVAMVTNKQIPLISIQCYLNNNTTNNNILKNPIYTKSVFAKVCSFRGVDYVKYICQLGFQLNNSCLAYACKGINIPVVKYLLATGLEATEENISTLMLNSRINSKRLRRRRNRHMHRLRLIFFKEACDTISIKKMSKVDKDQYSKTLIDIIDKFTKTKKNYRIVESIINNSIRYQLICKNFVLIKYILDKFNTVVNKYTLDVVLFRYITTDDLDSIKSLFEVKLLKPIDISVSESYLDLAFKYDADKIIKYFSTDLSMKCSQGIHRAFRFKLMKKRDVVKNIKYLEDFGITLDHTIFKMICTNGSIPGAKYLIEKGLNPTSNILEFCIANKQFALANFLIKNNCSYRKKNLLDRVICLMKQKTRHIYSQSNINCVTRYVNMLGGTATNVTVRILYEFYALRTIMYVYKNFNIKPGDNDIALFFKYIGNVSDDCELIEFINFLNNDYHINIFDIDKDIIKATISKLIGTHSVNIIDFFLKHTTYEFTIADAYTVINNYYYRRGHHDVTKMYKYLETKGLVITKDIFKLCIFEQCMTAVKYLAKQYNYKFTLNEIHNIIILDYTSITTLDTLFKYCESEITPYTVHLIAVKYCNRWDCHIVTYILNLTKTVTQETYDLIINKDIQLCTKALTNVKIVNYQIQDAEMPDVEFVEALEPVPSNNNIEKDYVETVLEEANKDMKNIEKI